MNTFSGELSEKEIEAQFGVKSTKYWSLEDARRIVRGQKEIGKNIRAYAYRPFDNRSILYVPEMIERGDAAHNVMQHMLRTNKAILCFRRIRDETLGCVFVADKLVDKTILSAKDNATVFSLYVYECAQAWSLFEESGWEPGIGDKIPNLSPEFVEEFSRRVKLEFVSDGAGDLKNTYGPEDILHYIYGAFHSPEYRRRYAEFLKIDFPRVPLPKSKALFRKLCKVGQELVKLHLMEAPILEDDNKQPIFAIEGNSVVEKGYPKYAAHADNPQKGRVYINKDQYFEGVNPDVWEFHIGGYQVCEKWLKDRRERELSFDDKKHYQKIVVALGETIRLMKEPCLSEMFD
jgi:predicted helicase